MASGNYWLMRCQYGSRRYWRAFPWRGLSCTREELPREVCRLANVNLNQVVAFTCESTGEVARIKGKEWVQNV